MIKERKICIKNMQNTKAGENPILPLLNASDCMQEAYAKALLELTQRAKKDIKTKEVLEQIFKNKVDKYEKFTHSKFKYQQRFARFYRQLG